MKKINPKDENILKYIKLEEQACGWFVIRYKRKHAGNITIDFHNNEVARIDIFPEYKRKGIATYVLNLIENKFNILLKPNKTVSKEGKMFFATR